MEVLPPRAGNLTISSETTRLELSAENVSAKASNSASGDSVEVSGFAFALSLSAEIIQLDAAENGDAKNHAQGRHKDLDLDGLTKEAIEKIDAFDSRAAKRFIRLIDSLHDDKARLKDFLKGIASVVRSVVKDTAQETESIAAGAREATKAGLLIQNSLSFSLDAQIESVYIASKNGSVTVQKFALELDLNYFSAKLAQANDEDPLALSTDGSGIGAVFIPPTPKNASNLPVEGETDEFPALSVFDINKDGKFDAQDVLVD